MTKRKINIIWSCKDRTHEHPTQAEAARCIYLTDAAPELLAACEGMLKHIDDVLDDEDLSARRAALVAAILKAKGRDA